MVQVFMNEEEFKLWEKFAAEEDASLESIADEADDAVRIVEEPDGTWKARTV